MSLLGKKTQLKRFGAILGGVEELMEEEAQVLKQVRSIKLSNSEV